MWGTSGQAVAVCTAVVGLVAGSWLTVVPSEDLAGLVSINPVEVAGTVAADIELGCCNRRPQ